MSSPMSMERMKASLEQIRNRAPMVAGRGEEATKQALVLPLIDALGYDIWLPSEVSPEYDADFAIRKGSQKEKVDLAVLLGGKPRIFFEVKAAGTPLDAHHGQLSRYFNAVPDVSLGVLTNGVEYRFFTDTGEPNLMDQRPFITINIESVDLPYEVLARFHRANFSAEIIRDYASDLIFTSQLITFIRDELDLRTREPSDALVRWILASASFYDGRVTGGVVERFRPLVKSALQVVLKDIVRRSVLAIDHGVTSEAVPDAAPELGPEDLAFETDGSEERSGGRAAKGIVTTPEEVESLGIVQRMAERAGLLGRTVIDGASRKVVPVVVEAKDTTVYYGIYVNKPAYWGVRLNYDGRQKWLGVNLEPSVAAALLPVGVALMTPSSFSQVRVSIEGPGDLSRYEALILAALRKQVDDHQR